MEIDIITDDSLSEADTVLNTPTLIRRCSSTKSSLYQVIDGLEKRVQTLESEIQQYVKREMDLESQLIILKQKQDKSIFVQLSKHIDQFLSSHEKGVSQSKDIWQSLTGSELPSLFDDRGQPVVDDHEGEDVTPIFLFRLKSFIYDHSNDPHSEICQEILEGIQAWEVQNYKTAQKEHEKMMREQSRVQRLLDALQKSLIKNKMLETDMSFILKKQKQDKMSHAHCQRKLVKCRSTYAAQVKSLEDMLSTCKEERDEFELTVEIVRREMENMMEEIEDTRQQKSRFKNQAARLKAGLEAIHRSRENEEQDGEMEAVRLLLNEAERQATDLDRECKRQALALTSVREGLKATEEANQVLVKNMRQEISKLQLSNEQFKRKIELLELSECSGVDEIDTYALQMALKAAKSDGVIQRARVYQLEKYHHQQLADLNDCMTDLQDKFKQELSKRNKLCIHQEFMQTVEKEQGMWKQAQLKEFQKKHDISLVNVYKEIRELSWKIVDLQEELVHMKERHKTEMNIERQKISEEYEKRIQQLLLEHRLKQVQMHSNLEILYQKNMTLKEESLILYGKNVALVGKLGKLSS